MGAVHHRVAGWRLAPGLLALGLLGPPAAQAAPPALVDRLHADGVERFRSARFSAAYGRFAELADMGHGPSARYAIWMCLHGLELFGKDWDCTGEQLQDWALAAGVAAPTLQPRSYARRAAGPALRR